jgi:hypothetical protein
MRRRERGGVRMLQNPTPRWLTFFGFSDTLSSHMRSSALVLIALVAVLQCSVAQTPSQRRSPRREPALGRETQNRIPNQADARALFGIIEQSILRSSLTSASSHFAQQVFVNMSGGESGYFSANQTVSILQRYFSSRSSLAFEFSRFSDTGTTPYATGRLTSTARGRRESAQVYVSLRFQDSRWVISQFNIY